MTFPVKWPLRDSSSAEPILPPLWLPDAAQSYKPHRTSLTGFVEDDSVSCTLKVSTLKCPCPFFSLQISPFMALNSLKIYLYVPNLTQFPGKNGMGCQRRMLKALDTSPDVQKRNKETQILSRVRDQVPLCSKQCSYPGLKWASHSSGTSSQGEKPCGSC